MKYRFPWQKAGLMDTPADLLNSFKTRDESYQQQRTLQNILEYSGLARQIQDWGGGGSFFPSRSSF